MATNRLWRWAFVVALAALAAGVWRVGSPASAAPSPGDLIATARVSDIVNGLEELKTREQDLKTLIEDLKNRITEKGKKLEEKGKQLELMGEASGAQREALIREMARLRVELEAENQISEAMIDRERGQIYSDLFEKIRKATAKVSERSGYAIVILDDSTAPVEGAGERAVRGSIIMRRLLYVTPKNDITQEIITAMNNDWVAGRPK